MKITHIIAGIIISALSGLFTELSAQSRILSGSVRDTDGNPVVEAVVTDGFTQSITDKNGNYRFESPYPERVRFVSVRIPSGYMPVVSGGRPVFFSEVPTYEGTERSAEIVLKKRTNPIDSFTLFMMADPQAHVYKKTIKKENVAYASTEAWKDLFGDMSTKIAATSGECYGICLGDVAASLKTGSVYPEYLASIETLGIPFYQVIGNHDHYYEIAENDDASAAAFEDAFGPRNYSFDLGQFHFVVLDNCIFIKNLRRYPFMYGLEDEFLEWLKGDLARVPKDMPVMICAHTDFFNEDGLVELELDGMKSDYKYAEFLKAIQGFDKLYVWAGHTHTTSFHGKVNTPANTSGVESYVVGRPTGDMPINEYVSGDGTPRGYVVVEAAGKEMTWKYRTIDFKSTPYRGDKKPEFKWNMNVAGETQQLRAYPRGAYGDDFIYANVFLWDQHWETPVLKVDGKTYQMTRDHIYDLGWKEINHYYREKSSKVPNIRGSRNSHGFMVRVPEKASGNGTVEVIDRFGRRWEQTVSVDPIKYDDGNKHLIFDFRVAPKGSPSEVSENVVIKVKKQELNLSKGCYKEADNVEDNHIVLSGKGSYLTLPAIKGYKLTEILVHPSGNRMKEQIATVTDLKGNEVKGGEELKFFGNVTDSWILEETAENTSYKIVSNDKYFHIGELRLTYSKIEQ